MGSRTPFQLPIVNFTDENLKPGTDAWLSACHVVRTALEDYGCFLARYDKVGPQLCSNVVSELEELFALPTDTKLKNTSDKPFHCYFGPISYLPLYESFAIEQPMTIDGCQKFANLMWPQGNDRFCEIINEHSKLLVEVEQLAKRMVFESYGVDMKRCDASIDSTNYMLRMIQYRATQIGETDLGMNSHTDMSMISVLHQVNTENALEVQLKNREWIEVDFISPSLFVVLAGDALKVWSNGRTHPCQHQVIMKAKKARYCLGLFTFSGEMVNAAEDLVDEEHPLRYKPFDHYKYLSFFDKERIKDTDQRITAYCGV